MKKLVAAKRKRKRAEEASVDESKLSMKLLIDTRGKRVLFAEAGKDCVDFLFFILYPPLSTLIRLIGKEQMKGPLPNLYESIETLNESYIQLNMTKDTLLRHALPAGYSVPLLTEPSTNEIRYMYRCGNTSYCQSPYAYVSEDPRVVCPSCSHKLTTSMMYVCVAGDKQEGGSSVGGGFVKEVVTYMVMDDLVVKPMSAISSITLINQLNITNASLEEKVVNLGMKQAVKLLKASLASNKVLTNVFLAGNK